MTRDVPSFLRRLQDREREPVDARPYGKARPQARGGDDLGRPWNDPATERGP